MKPPDWMTTTREFKSSAHSLTVQFSVTRAQLELFAAEMRENHRKDITIGRIVASQRRRRHR